MDVIKNTIVKMIDRFGEDSQIDVCIEEMSELTKELIKYKRAKIHEAEKNNSRVEHVLEEIGDVMFMFEYMKYIFNLNDEEIKKIVEVKAKRTAERYLKD